MQLQTHYHLDFKHYFQSALSKLELSVWLHTFGRSLVAIFIPILLLQMGFPLTHIIIFYLIYCGIDVPFNLIARNLTIKYGARKIIFIGIIFQIIALFILYFGNFSFTLLLTLAFTMAVYDAFYWVAHWFVFNECVNSKGDTGKKVSGLLIVRKLAVLITPLIGAGFLIFLNKNYLLAISIIFLFISLIPLSKLDFKYVIPERKMKFRELLKYKKNRKDFIYLFTSGFHSQAEGILLPLFVFVTFGSLKSVGALPVIATITSIIFSYYVGKWSDKFNTNILIFFGAILLSVIWIIRIMIPSVDIILLTAAFTGIFGVLVGVPIGTNLVRNGKKTSMIEVSTYRNLINMFSGFIFYSILLLSVEVFKVSFSITALSLFGLALISGFILRSKTK